MPEDKDKQWRKCKHCGMEYLPAIDGEPYCRLECELAADREERRRTCSNCGVKDGTVDEQYSFGIYAGRLCRDCAVRQYRDHCGLTGEGQGDPRDLDEVQAGGWSAYDGEDYQ